MPILNNIIDHIRERMVMPLVIIKWSLRVAVIGALIYFFFAWKEAKQGYNRLLTDGIIQQDSVTYYKGLNGELIAKSNVQENTVKEFKLLNRSIVNQLTNMKIKDSRINQYQQTVIQATGHITVPVRDTTFTVIMNDSNEIVCSERFVYSDNYLSLNGVKINNKQDIHYSYTDSLSQVIYKGDRINKNGKKMPDWWIFTKRSLQQSIMLSNPNAKVKFNKVIMIVK